MAQLSFFACINRSLSGFRPKKVARHTNLSHQQVWMLPCRLCIVAVRHVVQVIVLLLQLHSPLPLTVSLALVDPAFFAELGAADIMLNDTKIGVIGLVHPEVLGNFNLKLPVAAFELDLEALL
eukprot:m.173817 g.173817  ORF g.173817 m.173817 type:complete len:123 (+) comp14587_c0_seq9:2121-2489(+)